VNHNAVNFSILRNCKQNIEKQNLREKAHEPALFSLIVDESPLCSPVHKLAICEGCCFHINFGKIRCKINQLPSIFQNFPESAGLFMDKLGKNL
jgi:hypothetical protein